MALGAGWIGVTAGWQSVTAAFHGMSMSPMATMAVVMSGVNDFFEQYIEAPLVAFSWRDALDILLLTVILYLVYSFVRVRRAGKLAFGLAVILILYVITDIINLRATNQILAGISSFGIIIIAIIFQPELRDALEKVGSKLSDLRSNTRGNADMAHIVSEVVEAACQIAQSESDGALIVFENTTKLGDFATRGLALDAIVSGSLLRNIFVNRTPLHDGAVIIRNGRIAAACCKLPLSVNEEVVGGLGTRHRAAVGISEKSDCVVVVVSEERHIISLANNGAIKRDYNRGMSDFANEEKAKDIQNRLRADLFLLLTGVSIDNVDINKSATPKKKAKKSEPDHAEAERNVGRKAPGAKKPFRAKRDRGEKSEPSLAEQGERSPEEQSAVCRRETETDGGAEG